jgi:hypothetical protein
MRGKCFGVGLAASVLLAVPGARAAVPEVAAADTIVDINVAFMHTQYHENFPKDNSPQGYGDDEAGYSPGFGVGASALVPLRQGWNPDLYTSLDYDFNAGDIHYGGHYQSGGRLSATDNAVFNRIEAKLGLGFQIPGIGIEMIPFIAAGYQAWNRNINPKDAIGTDEFYHSGLLGGGIKMDFPVTPTLVVSLTPEVLGLVGGGIAINNLNLNQQFGPSAEQRVTFGLNDALSGRLHIIGSVYWEHFNYSGSKPQVFDTYYLVNEPLSITTQFGASIGVAYSFI